MRGLRVLVLIVSPFFTMNVRAAEFTLQQNGDAVEVLIDGELFTRYLTQSGTKPVLFPILGPTGVEMTRGYPIRPAVEGEVTDHPHHRSLWFSHGDVNGVDFWTEPGPDNRRKRGFGKIVHREFLRVQSGSDPLIVTRNEWLDSKEEKLLTDLRTLSFGAGEGHRWIDFDVRLVADTDQPVKFGDTKEGTFALRVASWMRVDAGKGGRIINSLGATDKDAWGKPASWVDYHAPHDGQVLGIAILNHPSSFRFPSYWHVRTYGLFAANVFGWHNFKNSDEEDGSYELKPGESLLLSYRVLLHEGDDQSGRVPEAFVDYAKVEKTPLTQEELAAESDDATDADDS